MKKLSLRMKKASKHKLVYLEEKKLHVLFFFMENKGHMFWRRMKQQFMTITVSLSLTYKFFFKLWV